MSFLSLILMGITDSYNERRNRIPLIVRVVILSLAFLLIVGMDRSYSGLIQVSQKPLLDLQQKLLCPPNNRQVIWSSNEQNPTPSPVPTQT